MFQQQALDLIVFMASLLTILSNTANIWLIISHHLNTCSNINVAAELTVQPLWTTSVGDNTPPCNIDERYLNSSMLQFQGSASLTCSLWIRASEDSMTLLRLPDTKSPADFIYIERGGVLKETECMNRFVVIKPDVITCDVIFSHSDLKVHLKGEISIVIHYIPNPDVNVLCPETYTSIRNRKIPGCFPSQLIGYKKEIYCKSYDTHLTYKSCYLNLDSKCTSTLSDVGVTLECLLENSVTIEKRMIIYPDNVVALNVSYNKITSFHPSSFLGLHDLRFLYLSSNMLETIIGNVFRGLDNLEELRLNNNRLVYINPDAFKRLYELKVLFLSVNQLKVLQQGLFFNLFGLVELHLDNNILHSLPGNIFSNLTNLDVLSLGYNRLLTLPPGVFADLSNLKYLWLQYNQLVKLPLKVFSDLNILKELHLDGNQLVTLPENLLSGLINLKKLDLSNNQLVTLSPGLFAGLNNLKDIYLHYNQLAMLPPGVFSDLNSLQVLHVDHNQLVMLPLYVFSDLNDLEVLHLTYNQLVWISPGLFSDLNNLKYLSLNHNQLETLPTDVFTGLDNLFSLSFQYNQLTTLQPGVFFGLTKLAFLLLNNNDLKTLHPNLFSGLHNLFQLSLENNRFVTLTPGMFSELRYLNSLFLCNTGLFELDSNILKGLNKLEAIDFSRNKLSEIPQGLLTAIPLKMLSFQENLLTHLDGTVLKGQVDLRYLFLSYNFFTKLDSTTFQECLNLTFIDLSHNKLVDIPQLNYLSHLAYLNVRNNSFIAVTRDSFSGLPVDIIFLVGQHEICECYTPSEINCSASYDRSPYLTCDRLLSDRVLVLMMWIIGLNAIFGNLFVFVWRKGNTKKIFFQDMLLSNLALSDFLMGVYMITIASADKYFGDNFGIQAETWRSGITCRIAGAICIISSEASVFFVTLISIDRAVGIRLPMSGRILGRNLATVIVFATWLLAVTLGIVPSVLANGKNNFKFYDIPNVCIGLPLALTESYSTTETNTKIPILNGTAWYKRPGFSTKNEGLITGMYFSTTLFLGLNCVCYLIIIICYILIVSAVRKSSTQSGRTVEMAKQIKLTIKVTAIVTTDFLCWFPIIILGICVQTRVLTLPTSVYAWVVTFVLPINSGINPYLYTISDIISKYRKKQTKPEKLNLNSITSKKTDTDTTTVTHM